MDNDDTKKPIGDLIAVMAALRTPVTGCPWDLEQDFSSIAPYTLEEVYEVLDAITRDDLIDLREELGDLLLQVVYHARMAEELGAFDFDDVVDGITRKMVRRHPHVFGTRDERAAGPQKGSWDKIKEQEKREKAAEKTALSVGKTSRTHVPSPAGPSGMSILADVPAALPALVRAIKLQSKAAKVGFDWPSLAPVFDKMREELSEFEEVVDLNEPSRNDHAVDGRVEEEFGDLLFVMANVARHLKIDPEGALRRANEKFVRRFGAIEAGLEARGSCVQNSNLSEMEALWNAAKELEKFRS